jgi:succinate dehydrogenase/fumarate reductase flavoprotein subunit
MANNVLSCDLAVVGGGGSGLTAAVKAKHLGVKNVIVLEAAQKTG